MPNGQPLSDREQRIAQARRARLLKRLGWGAGAIAILAGGAYAVVRYSGEQARDRPGVFFENQGQPHVALGTPFAYNSNPPTSGPHFAQPANWGLYDYEVPDQIFIHNLEHGGIWIAYRPSVPAAVVAELTAIVREFGGAKLVMAPRSANDADVSVAAWSRLLKFNLTAATLTGEQKDDIGRFYKAFRDRGPEFVPGNMPGIDPKSVQ